MIVTRTSPDVLVVGAGIMGLWAARRAILARQSVLVLDKRSAGSGASGGFLGALMPHMPDRWNDKKQFQYQGLSTMGDAIAELEFDTGRDCGFRRCGRLMPVRHEKTLLEIRQRIAGAEQRWRKAFSMELLQPPLSGGVADGWLSEEMAPLGVVYDNFSARVDPRAYVSTLAAYVGDRGEFHTETEIVSVEPEKSRVNLSDGSSISAGKIVIAAGWEAYPLLQPFMHEMAMDGEAIGRGAKGQAVLLAHDHRDDQPIIYDDGSYIVPQAGNRIAIGSTTRRDWQEGVYSKPDVFDPNDISFYENALRLAPSLAKAPITERWAAVRPRNLLRGRGTEPFLGPVPGHENLIALIGGFKISFGIAHLESSDFS